MEQRFRDPTPAGGEPTVDHRSEVPSGARPEPVLVRAGQARPVADTMEAVTAANPKTSWVGAWGRSAAKFTVGTTLLAGVSAAVGHFAGVDAPSALAIVVNGALAAVVYKPLEWVGGKAIGTVRGGLSRAVELVKGKRADAASQDAEPPELRVANGRPVRGAEVDDAAAHFAGPAGEVARGADPQPAVTHDERIAAFRFIAEQQYLATNPGAPLPPPMATQHVEEVLANAFAHADHPEARQLLDAVDTVALQMREGLAAEPSPAAGATAHGPEGHSARRAEAEPRAAQSSATTEPPPARRARRREKTGARHPEGGREPAGGRQPDTGREPAARREPTDRRGPQSPAPRAETPRVGEGVGYQVVDDEQPRS